MLQCMLAGQAPEDLSQIKTPAMCSFKVDGIRALPINGVVYSRNMKPIPNEHVQKLFGKSKFDGLDGELIVGDPYGPDVYRNTSSAVMSRDGKPDVTFFVFDNHEQWDKPFHKRYSQLAVRSWPANIQVLEQLDAADADDIIALEETALELGYEGLMIRDPDAQYKFGRSTTREGALLKLKRFLDSEAVIQDVTPRFHNSNVQERDELGRAKRSKRKEGLVVEDMLGNFVVQDVRTGVRFEIGTGLTESERAAFWVARKQLLGRVVKYKYFPVGVKEKPRLPVYLGFRDPIDF